MRIIAGKKKGAKLKAPRGLATRPLLARIKKSLFSILEPGLKGSRFLDLFAGSGSVGLEALSRGAEFCVFVDNKSLCIRITKDNLQHLNLESRARILQQDFRNALSLLAREKERFNYIFIGPPYDSGYADIALKHISQLNICHKDSVIIAETRRKESLNKTYRHYHLTRRESYGDTLLWFYTHR